MPKITERVKDMLSLSHQKEQILRYLLLLAVLVGYFGYCAYEYGLASGGLMAALTWSFFVLCTPIADAGFLLDFPVRLLTGMRMLFSEMMVWTLAFALNAYAYFFAHDAYQNSAVTRLLEQILSQPWPYWGIIGLCMAGTFLSVLFGDEIFDAASHKDRDLWHKHGFLYKIIACAAFFALIAFMYYRLIEQLGIEKIFEGG